MPIIFFRPLTVLTFTGIRFGLVLAFLGTTVVLHAQSIQFDWVKTLDHSHGSKLVLDSNKAVIVYGSFSGTVDFDPGPGVFNMTSGSAQNLYIAKYDTAGNFIWAKQIASPADLFDYDMKMDKNGDLLLLGTYQQSVDFDPGPGTMIFTSPYNNGFLLKLDNSGNFIWVKTVVYGLRNMDIDGSGNIILAGPFDGMADFDPGPGTYMATVNTTNYSDMAVVKLDASANFIWMRQIRNLGTGTPETFGVRTDADGDIVLAGAFSSTMDFDPGPGTTSLTSAGSQDAYVLKLDAQGKLKWVEQFGAAGSDRILAMEVDKYGSVYSTGSFQNSVDFDPGPGVSMLTASPLYSCFVSKLDKDGHFVYAKSFQSGSSYGQSLAIDSSNNLYIAGNFGGTVDFDPGPGVYNVTGWDLFTVKLDENGNFAWVAPYMDPGTNWFGSAYSAIKVDILKNVYYTGWFANTVDFDPGPGAYLASASPDVGSTYIHKLSQCHNTLNTIDTSSCDPYTLNGIVYSSPGLYYQTLTNSAGCDSIIQVTLTRKEVHSRMEITTCGAYVWNGTTLTASGIYRDTFPSTTACDSVAALHLTLTNKDTTVATSVCGTFTWNGVVLTASGDYTDTFHLAGGCDSTVLLHLVVLPNPSVFLGRDTVLCKGDSVVLSSGEYSSYVWSDNSTASTLLVKDTGTYWVQVTDIHHCKASDTIRIMPSGQCSCSLGEATKVYPTPFRNYLYIDKEHTTCTVRMSLYSIVGQRVRKDVALRDGRNGILLSDLAEGMYIYRLHSDGRTLMTGKVMKWGVSF